jgi:transposase
MEARNAAYQLYVGIDVAAETFVAAWLAPGGQPTAPVTGEQTPAGFATLQRRLQATGSPPTATLVVLEATGNLGLPPLHGHLKIGSVKRR